MRRSLLLLLIVGIAWAGLAWAVDQPYRQVRLARVALGGGLPEDLVDPEGKSRWDLTSVTLGAFWTRTLAARGEDPSAAVITDVEPGSRGATSSRLSFTDPTGGDAAIRWLFPDGDEALLRPGAVVTLRVEVEQGGSVDRLWIESRQVGVGRLDLPSGPREVVLLRDLVLREAAGSPGFVPDRLLHRWVEPGAGVVAEVGGPVSDDGLTRVGLDEALVVDEVIDGAADLKIYADELDSDIFEDLLYGWNKGEGTPVSSLTPEGYATIGDLIAADSWDFSGNTSGTEIASTTVPINSNETCNFDQCGYSPPAGKKLGRRDEDFDIDPSLSNQVTERIDDVTGVTISLRAGAQKEGESGGFGSGESRFCYVSGGRTEVPLWKFTHQDALGDWFMEAGDAWSSGVFACEQNVYDRVCGDPGGLFPDLWIRDCIGNDGSLHEGKQSADVLKGGVVTLPSGHTLNTLLVRNVADFCVYSGPACFVKFDEVRTVIYLWQVPHLGTVVLLQSEQNVPDLISFSTLDVTNISFGLLPPLSTEVLGANGSTDTTVELSWNPGNDTHRIADHVIYWDIDSGDVDPYDFNSLDNPGQVAFNGTTATISGLNPDTTYFFTVTSRSNYTDPKSGDTTTYESILYPTQVQGDPDFAYPVEVQGATTGGACVPTEEVSGLTVDKVAGGCEVCWRPASDPCLIGYRVLGADSPESDANFSPLAGTGLQTCWTGNPTESFFLSVVRGSGGDGPWGHYGR